jgi:hypothetical protein
LGKVGDKSTENEVLLLEHDIPHSKFSEAVLDCLPELPWGITPEVMLKQNFVTIFVSYVQSYFSYFPQVAASSKKKIIIFCKEIEFPI